jgi:flagellin-like hook-associated protein FlgL
MNSERDKRGLGRERLDSNGSDERMLTLTDVAEIKEVVGRLYKQVTSLETSQKSEREKDRAELAAWAQTNLIQTQLLGKQTAVIEILTAERLSQQSETLSESLLAELQSLKNLLGNMPKSSPNVENLELKGLKSEVVALREVLKGIPQKLEKVSQGQTTLEARQSRMEDKLLRIENQTDPSQNQSGITGWNSEDWSWFVGKAILAILVLGGLWATLNNTSSIKSTLAETWERAGWSNTKLERIEKKLRIRSNS